MRSIGVSLTDLPFISPPVQQRLNLQGLDATRHLQESRLVRLMNRPLGRALKERALAPNITTSAVISTQHILRRYDFGTNDPAYAERLPAGFHSEPLSMSAIAMFQHLAWRHLIE